MPIHDITLPVSPKLAVWPDLPPVAFEHLTHVTRGDDATTTNMHMTAHTGTHVDAPAHFIADGSGVDQLDLDLLVGPAAVVDAREADLLTADVLEGLAIPAGTKRVIFLTRNSARWGETMTTFDKTYVAMERTGAQWIVDRGIGLVGIDYLSIAAWSDLAVTHQILLGAGVVIVEGLDLRGITPDTYQLTCLPLKLLGRDGAPARAILTDL